MLTITIPDREVFLEDIEQFVTIKGDELLLEHSLISVQKWEQKWHKPYLGTKEKTPEELIDYIRCMTINKVNETCYLALTQENLDIIIKYIQDPMTATWFSKDQEKLLGASSRTNEVVTAEIIYYWMIALNIPVEFQKWHLSSLLTLIKVVNLKEAPKKKMSMKEAQSQQRALNQARRAKHHSKG